MSLDAYHALTRAPDPGAPLIFAFHGTGGGEDQLFALARQLVPGAGVVAPRGDVSERGAARFFRRTGEGVYDMADLARARAKMAGFVATHKAQHPGAQVLGFGYSNGANILAAILLEGPRLFDRAALLHPLIPWAPGPNPALAGLPVLITAGARDPICPLPRTEALVAYLTAQGAALTTDVHPGGHELRESELHALARFLTHKA